MTCARERTIAIDLIRAMSHHPEKQKTKKKKQKKIGCEGDYRDTNLSLGGDALAPFNISLGSPRDLMKCG